MTRISTICMLGFVTVAGCRDDRSDAAAGDGTSDSGGVEEGSDESRGDESGEPPPQSQCGDEAIAVGPTPMRRLTRTEYNNTVRDLLGDTSRPADAFVPDETVMGFAANAEASVGDLDVEHYIDAAEVLAENALLNPEPWLSCDPDDATCIEDWLADFGMRAYRRPLTGAELETLRAIYNDGRDAWGAEEGLELAVATALASPQFLYHVELGVDGGSETLAMPLSSYEMASRLSYFVWGSMPDETLFAAAGDDQLEDASEVEAQVRRMMDDPKFADAVSSFHNQWLELDVLDNLTKDPELFPQWGPEYAEAARTETLTFADEVIRNGDGTLGTLLSASFSYVNAELAAVYGVTPPSEPFARVELDASERAGLLTQAGFLAAKSHETENSWVHRGRFVRARLLCEVLPPPPPGIDFNEGNNPGRLEDPMCAGCHELMDPIGWGLDDYDPIGRFTNAGSSGEILGGPDIAGPFEGAVELAELLTGSTQVQDCVAETWFAYAARRVATLEDQCSSDTAKAVFAESDADIRELIVAIATSDSFRYRAPIED